MRTFTATNGFKIVCYDDGSIRVDIPGRFGWVAARIHVPAEAEALREFFVNEAAE